MQDFSARDDIAQSVNGTDGPLYESLGFDYILGNGKVAVFRKLGRSSRSKKESAPRDGILAAALEGRLLSFDGFFHFCGSGSTNRTSFRPGAFGL